MGGCETPHCCLNKCHIPIKSAFEIMKSAYLITDRHAFDTPRGFAGFGRGGHESPNTDYHINLSKGKKHFKNKHTVSTEALCSFSESPFVAQVNHLFEDTNSKRTALHRSADAISETGTTRNINRGNAEMEKTLFRTR